MDEPILVLQPGRERSLQRRHPWVFSGALGRMQGRAGPGDTVVVASADGTPFGRASYHPKASILARMWTFDPDERVDGDFFARRIAAAVARRAHLAARTDAVRLVFGESDGLPGVVVDRYGGWVVVQLGTPGADRWRREIVEVLAALPGVQGVYERSDTDAREREGLVTRVGVLAGAEPPDRIEIVEDGCRHLVDVRRGQKTGWYLDQRDNRAAVAREAAGRRMLEVFSYSGAFGTAALAAGAADVVSVDSSGPALALAAEERRHAGLPTGTLVEADAFKDLRQRRDAHERYDLIVVDPPKLAPRESYLERASRAYKDVNWLAIRLLAPGGLLATFSCSAAMSAELFQKILFGAATDARRDLQIVQRLGPAPDHPVLLSFPESDYLTGLLLRAV
jgi:23S rRNA (cytosine1962-C5)-methyltransferase